MPRPRKTVKPKKARPPARQTDLTHVDGDPGAHYRWVNKRNLTSMRRKRLLGYEPVRYTEIEEGKLQAVMGMKNIDGFVGEGELVLMKVPREDYEKRQEKQVAENVATVRRQKEKYIEDMVRSGHMTEREAEIALKEGIVVDRREHA